MKSDIRRQSRRFWVVGGEYADTAFSRMVPGTETVIGPLESHDAALAEWRRLSESGRAECLRRYSIASE
ncbi:MAG: hypothetical protein ACE5ED_01155 [Rhodothalassiaceae bacterium]